MKINSHLSQNFTTNFFLASLFFVNGFFPLSGKDLENQRDLYRQALTYESLGQYRLAIPLLHRRIKQGGDQEEIWHSVYMIGACYEGMGFWDHALHWYHEAYARSPERAEPLQKIAAHYRMQGKNYLAYLYAKQGAAIPCPSSDHLSVSRPVYDYQLDEEISIAAYYTPFKKEGFAAVNRLLLKKGVPKEVKGLAYRNLLFYMENLKDAEFQPIEFKLPLIRQGLKALYAPMNASLLRRDEGYLLLCRTVNYDKGLFFTTRDPFDHCLRSRNFLLEYDKEWVLHSQKEIIEHFPKPYELRGAEGLEDCRMFLHEGSLWFTCATLGTHPHSIGQTLCQLEDERKKGDTLGLKTFIPLKIPNPHRHEKNWLPLVKEGELLAFYSYDPLIIYRIDMQNGDLEKYMQKEQTVDFSNFRGSAGPIEFDGGYLMLIHEPFGERQEYYAHRFLYLNKDFEIEKLSNPFSFKHKGVEYCAGMAIDHTGTKCLMPISLNDCEAWLCSVSLEVIRSLLTSL